MFLRSKSLACARTLLLGIMLAWAAPDGPARAYSDPLHYTEAAELGGGGGRWFTGSPADGYDCGVCHLGGTPSELAVRGLPLDGFVPGAAYEVSLLWPPTTSYLALVAEVTDERRRGAGTLALPRPEALSEPERCGMEAEGHPASQLHATDGGRQLLSVIDCGARMVRFQWTAPTAPTDTVWFNVGFVASNKDGSPAGDGVTLVRRRLPVTGTQTGATVVAQGCSARPAPHESRAACSLLTAAALMLRRHRLRAPR